MNLEDIRDIKPPVDFPANPLFLIIAAVIIVLAVLIFLFNLLKKNLRKKREQSLPPKSADQIALEALQSLKARNLPASGKTKEYYFCLSDIVRRYIEERFIIRAPEMTTEEFLFYLRDSGILSRAHKDLLKEFLNLCDIVKFAKYGPSEKEINDSFEAAIKLVNETKEAQAR